MVNGDPMPEVGLEALCFFAFTTGVNPGDLWFQLGNIVKQLEFFAVLGRFATRTQTAMDIGQTNIIHNWLHHHPLKLDGGNPFLILSEEMRFFARRFVFDYPARANGIAMPLPGADHGQWLTIERKISSSDFFSIMFPPK